MKKSILICLIINFILIFNVTTFAMFEPEYEEYNNYGLNPVNNYEDLIINNIDVTLDDGKFITEYEIYNTKGKPITSEMVMPFDYDTNIDQRVFINDKKVDSSIGIYYDSYYEYYDFKSETEFRKIGSYTPDTKVTKITFHPNLISLKATFKFQRDSEMKVVTNNYVEIMNDSEITINLSNKEDLVFYVVSDSFSGIENVLLNNSQADPSTYTIISEEIKLLDLAKLAMCSKYALSDVEAYNIYVEELYEAFFHYTLLFQKSYDCYDRIKVSFEPFGTTKVKTISDATYYTDDSTDPVTHEYRVNLSSKWHKIEKIKVKVFTDKYVLNKSYKKVDGAYTYESTEDLYVPVISVCSSKHPITPWTPIKNFFVTLNLILLLIPIVVYIIFMFESKKRSDGYNFLRRLLYTETLFAVLAWGSSLLGLDDGYLGLISISCFVISFILFIIRFMKENKKPIFLTIVYLLLIVLCIVVVTDDIYTAISMIGLMLFLTVPLIFSIQFYHVNKYDSKKYSRIKTTISRGYIPIGYRTKKSYHKYIISIVTTTLIALFAIFSASAMEVSIVPYIILFIVAVFIIILVKVGNDNIMFTDFQKNLDKDKLCNEVINILQDPSVHPETKNNYVILLSSYIITCDIDMYNKLVEKIHVPVNKTYKINYDMSKLNYLLSYEEFVRVYSELKFKYKRYSKALDVFYNRWMSYYTGKCEDIDKVCPINTKNNMMNCTNLFIQIHYYYKNNNLIKYEELKNIFLNKYQMQKELVKKINELDNINN